jgi:hypothetical protein
MSSIIQISDFESGRNSIALNRYQTDDLQTYIDKYERKYLLMLFGQELYDLFIADLDVNGIPQRQKYLDLFNPFYKEIYNEFFDSLGLKKMLEGVVYFYFVRDKFSQQTTVGVSKSKSENSDNVGMQTHDLYSRYNNSGETFESIRAFLLDNEQTYPEFNGTEFPFTVNL